MATQLHTYTANVRWSGGREGTGDTKNGGSQQAFDLRVPPEFGGPGGALNPEELLTDAITGCYAITYGIVAANRKLPVTAVQVESVGTVEQNGASFIYTSIALAPKILVSSDATDEQIAAAIDSAHKADAYCIVTNAVRGKVNVTISPTVERENAAPASAETPPPTPDTLSQGAATPNSTPTEIASDKMVAEGDSTNAAPAGAPAQTPAAPTGNATESDGYAAGGTPTDAGEIAPKPASATPSTDDDSTAGAAGAGEQRFGGGQAPQNQDETSGAAPATGGTGEATNGGAAPSNADADKVTATSEQVGDPESMPTTAIPG